MTELVLGGVLLLAAWTWWTLYIADRQPAVTVSLLLKVQQGEDYLDPLLRMVCQLFRNAQHIKLREIWILTQDDGEKALRIVERLDATYPLFRFRPAVGDGQVDFAQASGDVLLYLDLVNRLTPVVALQAVTQLLANGPTPPGTIALPTGS